jgi:hypothetical protein
MFEIIAIEDRAIATQRQLISSVDAPSAPPSP